MRVVAGHTAQASIALAVALTHSHHRIVLKKRGNLSTRLHRQLKDRYCLVERRTGTKIQIFLAGLQYSSRGSLVAIHADVIREPTGQLGRVNDRVVKFTCHRQLPASFIHVQLAGAVAVLTADRQLSKRRVLVGARPIWNGLHSTAVTGETPCLYGAA